MHGRYERLTRQELYDLVWTTPIVQLCDRFQLSDRGLAKLCARHDIPVPERGWWAKHAAGQPLQRTPLPKPTDPYKERIELYVREDWRAHITPEEYAWFDQRLTEETTRPAPIVREQDDSRHPLIVQARRNRKPDETERPRFAIDTSKELLPRALRLATALVEACEQRGYTFAPRPKSETGAAGVTILGQLIGIAIEEPFTKVPHVLTKAEAREKAIGRGWQIPEFDSARRGQLAITLDHPISGERRSFGEKPERPLETTFPDVLKTLLRVALRMRAEEHYRAEESRRQQEAAERRVAAERQRREEEARQKEERRRRRELVRHSAMLRRRMELQQLIAAVEVAARERGVVSTRLAEWLTNAHSLIQALNPVDDILDSLTLQTHAPNTEPR